MENKIILKKGKYFLEDVSEFKKLKPVLVIYGDDGAYSLFDFNKNDEVDYVYKDSRIGVFEAIEHFNYFYDTIELKEDTEVSIKQGCVVFGEEFLLVDRTGRLDLTSVEKF